MKKVAGIILGIVAIAVIVFFAYSATSSERSCERQGGMRDGDICKFEISSNQEPDSKSSPRDIDAMERGQLPSGESLDEKTVKVEGKMAKEICAVIGGECSSFYPGNIQDDGSIMVGFVISEKEKTKHYQFFIKNDTLSYDEAIIENED